MLLRDFLRRRLGLSCASVTRLKSRESGILIDGVRVTVRAVLREGATLELDEADGEGDVNAFVEPIPLPFDIIYEDNDIIAVNKPAGMPTHTSHGHRRDTLANAAAYYFARRGIPFVFRAVNRLDRDTSGIVVLAKSKQAAYRLGTAVNGGATGFPDTAGKRLKFKKEYFAVLRGIINPAEPLRGVFLRSAADCPVGGVRSGSRQAYAGQCVDVQLGGDLSGGDLSGGDSSGAIDAPIRRALPSIMLREVSFTSDASDAVTEFEVVSVFDDPKFGPLTAVRAFPLTGRTHQLRVHFAYMGCPVAGDTLYGPFASDAAQPIARQALHCSAMTLGALRLEARLPEDILKLINVVKSDG